MCVFIHQTLQPTLTAPSAHWEVYLGHYYYDYFDLGVFNKHIIGVGSCSYITVSTLFLYVNALAPPTELTVIELSPTSFTISWRPPLGEVRNGSTLYYLVNVTDTEEESVVLLQHTVNSTVLQLRVAELLPNHVHQVSVAAVSGEETGPAVTVWIKTSAVTAAGKCVDSLH